MKELVSDLRELADNIEKETKEFKVLFDLLVDLIKSCTYEKTDSIIAEIRIWMQDKDLI